jgi:Flp pilus assembly protein TadB
MDFVTISALIAAAGAFLLVNALLAPRRIRLEQPTEVKGLRGLQARLDAAELPITAREFLAACGGVAVMACVAALFLNAPALILAGLIIGPILVWMRLEGQRDKFRLAYDQSLAECVQLLREGFAATGALRDAIDHAARNGIDPAAADFREVWSGHVSGMEWGEAFAPITLRRRNPYLRMVAEALSLKAKEGGQIGEVLIGLETMIREQVTLRKEITAKQAESRIESIIVSLAPIGFFLGMKLVPMLQRYEGGFYTTVGGQIALVVVVLLSVAAFTLARWLAGRGLTLDVKEVAG